MSSNKKPWIQTTLGKFISIQRGHDLTHKERRIGNIPVMGAAGQNGYHNKAIASGPGIVIGRSGGSYGKVHFINEDYWPHNTALYVTDFKKNDPYFTYYLLKLLDFSSLNSGSAQPSLNRNYIYPLLVNIPQPEEQQRIAKVLSDLDAKIELNNKINAELEAMAKLIYDYWFVQFDFPFDFAQGKPVADFAQGKPSANGKPYKSSGGKMVYNEVLKREIPEGWEVKNFGKYSQVKSGFAFKSSWWVRKGIPVLKIKDIQEDYSLNQNDFSFVTTDKIEVANKFKSKAGDVVIAMTGATIGKFAIIPYSEKSILINQRVGLYDLGDSPFIKLPFLFNSMKQEFFRQKIFQIAGGAAQPNISGEQLDAFPLIQPNFPLIEKYNSRFKSLYKKITNNIFENQKLTELRDWLLPMLMNGQVTVTEAEEKVKASMEGVAG